MTWGKSKKTGQSGDSTEEIDGYRDWPLLVMLGLPGKRRTDRLTVK